MSRLLAVIHHHPPKTNSRRRFRVAVHWIVRLVVVSFAGIWLFLYIDSVYQRRRAEALFADLKSLDFATASFPEVRDILTRYGGAAIQMELRPQFPDFGASTPDGHGNIIFTGPRSRCTPHDCTFLLRIMTRLPRTLLLDRTTEFFYTALPYVGVRSWALVAWFEVRNGMLDRSVTSVTELRMERRGSRRELVPLGYEVETRRDAASFDGRCVNQDYRVFITHGVFKLPENVLFTCVVQSAGIRTKRAFDVNLRCLNGLFRSCRFDELAPSAWADYSAMVGTTGARDP